MTKPRTDAEIAAWLRKLLNAYPLGDMGWPLDAMRAAAVALEQRSREREALESIAANTCCKPCQEAALVARAALLTDGAALAESQGQAVQNLTDPASPSPKEER